MKIANVLIVFGITFACICGSANAGMRGDGASVASLANEDEEIEDYEEGEIEAYEDEAYEDEDFTERLLAKNKLKKRCPFPGEVDNVKTFCKDDTSLFKPNKWCKKYCFLCACWDLKTHYDWKGNLIEDVCSKDLCGIKNPKRPCEEYPNDPNCCECTRCKKCEILPPYHYLCTKPSTCTLKPYEEGEIETYEDEEDEDSRKRLPCGDVMPNKNDGNCPGLCPISGEECFADGVGGCVCRDEKLLRDQVCEDKKPLNGKCYAYCQYAIGYGGTYDRCTTDGKGGCKCPTACVDVKPEKNGYCNGTCLVAGGDKPCVAVSEHECACQQDPCHETKVVTNQDGSTSCPGFCNAGGACVPVEGSDNCACEQLCVSFQDVEGLPAGFCHGSCPSSGCSCVRYNGLCLCPSTTLSTPCAQAKVVTNQAGTRSCPGFCDAGGVCLPVTGTNSCACETFCEQRTILIGGVGGPPVPYGCEGTCPSTGKKCVEDKGHCLCEP